MKKKNNLFFSEGNLVSHQYDRSMLMCLNVKSEREGKSKLLYQNSIFRMATVVERVMICSFKFKLNMNVDRGIVISLLF